MKYSRMIILTALLEEMEAILPKVRDLSQSVYLNSPLWKGNLCGHKIILRTTGIGKVNAALTTQCLIKDYPVSHIYNVGVGGSISPKVKIGDVVIANKVTQSDFDLSVFGYPKGHIPGIENRFFPTSISGDVISSIQREHNGYQIRYGSIVSADQFVQDREAMVKLAEEFDALAKDMESAAIGHVCYVNKIPFIAIRGICDNSGKFAIEEYRKNLKLAVNNSTDVLLELIKNHKDNYND